MLNRGNVCSFTSCSSHTSVKGRNQTGPRSPSQPPPSIPFSLYPYTPPPPPSPFPYTHPPFLRHFFFLFFSFFFSLLLLLHTSRCLIKFFALPSPDLNLAALNTFHRHSWRPLLPLPPSPNSYACDAAAEVSSSSSSSSAEVLRCIRGAQGSDRPDKPSSMGQLFHAPSVFFGKASGAAVARAAGPLGPQDGGWNPRAEFRH